MSQGRWIGGGKWLARRLDNEPNDFGHKLASGLKSLVATGDKQPLIKAVSQVRSLTAGPIAEGFVAHKPIDKFKSLGALD